MSNSIATYAVDPSHSRVGFTARHLGFSKVRGSFEQFEGTIRVADNDLSTLEVEATIQAATVTTNDAKRDDHLRTGDFLLVESHPTITFKSTGVKSVSGNSFVLEGEFTLRGVTKTVELEGEFLGKGKDPWGNERAAFEARTRINRKEYGVNWNAVLETGGFLVSDDVDINLEIQATLQTVPAPAVEA